ncbi:TonB-dependent siderophore receptor [soil metagenome]
MGFKRTHLSQAIFVALGLAGIACPFSQALAEDGAKTEPAVAGEDATAKPAVVETTSLPMTKNVVTRAAMDAMDTQDGYAEAIKNVAGVSSSNAKGSANDAVRIRGIQLNLFTDYRLNGGLPITGVMSFPTDDKERIEALKGANALMFGIASPAGIINLITKRATVKDVSALTLSGNAFGQYGVGVDLGRRFGDEKQFGVRVNVAGTHLENGIEDASGKGQFGSVAADWKVNKQLTVKLDYENYRKDVVEQASVSLSPVDPKTGQIPVPQVPNPRKLLSGTWDVYHPRTENKQLRADYMLAPDWKATFEVSRSDSDRTRLQDRIDIGNNLATGLGANNVSYIANEYATKFARAELMGKFSTWTFKHDLTFGVSSTDRLSRTSTTTGVQPAGQQQNIYNPVILAPPKIPTGALSFQDAISKNTGIYVYDTIALSQNWKFLAGMRETSFDFENQRGKTTGKTSSPAVGLLYDIAPNTTVYTSYLKGLEEGAVAPTNKQTINSGEILPPAVASQAEFGIRSTYFKGVNASLAYFSITRPNAITDPVTGIFANAGTNQFRGFETTISADIDRWWSVNASGQLMQATQKSTTDINGKVPENTPKVVASLSVTHRTPLVPGLSFTAGTSYVGERYINPQNQGVIPSVTLFSLGSGYTSTLFGRKTALTLNIDNLTNRRYWNSVATGTYGAGMDRTVKFNAKIDF